MNYEYIKALNPHINVYKPEDQAFSEFGRILTGYDFSGMVDYVNVHTSIPSTGNIYVASVEAMESMTACSRIFEEFYGEMPLQVGYCNGRNSSLNALEYHKGSEINVAVTDLVLLLGKLQDIKDNTYDTGKIQAFYVPSGCAVELYGTTLHFAPCKTTEDGFKDVVILPRGTNLPLKSKQESTPGLLFATNKWLISHPSNIALLEKGALSGINGANVEIKIC